jgi:hypothetical protein
LYFGGDSGITIVCRVTATGRPKNGRRAKAGAGGTERSAPSANAMRPDASTIAFSGRMIAYASRSII